MRKRSERSKVARAHGEPHPAAVATGTTRTVSDGIVEQHWLSNRRRLRNCSAIYDLALSAALASDQSAP